MKVALTGATGFIGSHILAELREHGHQVTALVRDDAQADIASANGATPKVVDLFDRSAVASAFGQADAAVHTANPGDATSEELDAAVVDGAIDAFAGTGRPYVHISGVWIYGNNLAITEESPNQAPALVAWRKPIESKVIEATGMRGVVLVSSVAYGDGGGAVPGVLLGSPRDPAGNLITIGTGQQHWSTVHVVDLADVFRRALENDSASGHYIVGDGVNPDRRRAHQRRRRCRCRAGCGGRFRRRGAGEAWGLLRRGPVARSRHVRESGTERTRLAAVAPDPGR